MNKNLRRITQVLSIVSLLVIITVSSIPIVGAVLLAGLFALSVLSLWNKELQWRIFGFAGIGIGYIILCSTASEKMTLWQINVLLFIAGLFIFIPFLVRAIMTHHEYYFEDEYAENPFGSVVSALFLFCSLGFGLLLLILSARGAYQSREELRGTLVYEQVVNTLRK